MVGTAKTLTAEHRSPQGANRADRGRGGGSGFGGGGGGDSGRYSGHGREESKYLLVARGLNLLVAPLC